MQRIVLLVCSFLSINILFAQDQQLNPVYKSIGSNTNGYYEYLPQGYSSVGTTKYPALIFIEGQGEYGDGSATQLSKLLDNGPLFYIHAGQFPTSFTVNGKTFKYVIITPQFIQKPTPDDIDQVINYAIGHYNIDINRIYLTGFSIGGGVAFEYAGNSVSYANKIAALIPFSSATEPDLSVVIPRARNIANANLPVWAFHNQFDVVSDTITTNYVKYIDQYAASNTLAMATIYPASSHDSWSSAYYGNTQANGLNIYQWMLQFQRNSIVNPLPLQLVSFTVTCSADGPSLSWKTAQENNSLNFYIEKSTDGILWKRIGTLPAAGYSSNEKEYKFKDINNNSSQCIYQVVEQDINGKLTYSSAVKLACHLNNLLRVYPNPISGNIILHAELQIPAIINIEIYDNKGLLLTKKTSSLLAGQSEIYLNADHFAKGMYTVRAIWLNQIKFITLIKQ